MEVLIAYLIAGLVSGAIYSLIGVGMNLLLVVSRVVQFAYGEVVVFGMYICWLIHSLTGSYLLGFIAAIMVAIVLTLIIETLLRGLRERQLMTETLVITIAIGMILTEVMAQYLNHGHPVAFSGNLVGGGWDHIWGLIRITGADVYVVIASIVFTAALVWYLFNTRQGKGLRAIAYNIQAAKMLGIPLRKSTLISFVITGILSGITGILFIITMGVATPELGAHVTFKGMAVMMIGGMGSLKGAVVGGLLLGLIECLVRGYFIGDWVDAIAMGAVMIVIIVKPGGLMGNTQEHH
jgi:branched-chain amino acid transport system permease protein